MSLLLGFNSSLRNIFFIFYPAYFAYCRKFKIQTVTRKEQFCWKIWNFSWYRSKK